MKVATTFLKQTLISLHGSQRGLHGWVGIPAYFVDGYVPAELPPPTAVLGTGGLMFFQVCESLSTFVHFI